MGALTFDALLRSLKQGAPDSVYYLHGEEDVLKDEAVRVLLERAVDPAARDFNVDQRTAADLDPEAFNALVNTPPILAATRAVVLRGMEQLRKTAKVRQELLHYLDSPNPSTVLVLVHGTPGPPDAELLRRATAVEVAALPPERVERWMTHRAKQLGFTLTPEAGELLLASVGNDLSGLARELEKLAPLCAGRPATRDEVAALVGVRRGETLQDFVDAALERRAADAARLVEPVLEQAGMSGVRMLSALCTALVGTALARASAVPTRAVPSALSMRTPLIPACSSTGSTSRAASAARRSSAASTKSWSVSPRRTPTSAATSSRVAGRPAQSGASFSSSRARLERSFPTLARSSSSASGARVKPNCFARWVIQRTTRSGGRAATSTPVARRNSSASGGSGVPCTSTSTVLGLGESRYCSSSWRTLAVLRSCSIPLRTTARVAASIGGVFTSALNASGSRSAAVRWSTLKSRAAGSTARSSSTRTASSFSTSSSPWR